ncbi:MAG TPA: hypothetical protein VKM55_24300 [Candidatus Lokiarchaeia archaeon]|nr:hypothetical protein [Candidatus Lokiarchaeia archaeon]
MNQTSKGKAVKVNGMYLPAERVFTPAVANQHMDDAFIERVLRVGGMLRDIGDLEGAFACYEHFINQLRRFTTIPLGEVADRVMYNRIIPNGDKIDPLS